MEMEKQEWHRLVKRAMGGNREAFDEVYRAKAQLILAHAGRLVYNPAAVGDAVQEIAVRMFASIVKLRSPEAFNVWLYRIILNTCHTVNKQNGTNTCISLDKIENQLEENEMQHLPVDAAEQKDRDDTISRAIGSLPEKQRLTLVMYYFDEMSYKEIAQILNTTTSAVGMNILKAKKSLKTKLSGGMAEEGGNARLAVYGAALVPHIQQALRADVARLAPLKQVEAMTEKTLRRIGGAPAAKGGFGAVLAKGAGYLVVTACALSLCGAMLAGVLLAGRQPSAPPVMAEIVMEGGEESLGEHINPTGILLHLLAGDAQVLEWHIEDRQRASLRSGTSEVIEEELAGLAPGEYQASWLVQTPDGRRTWIHRDFEIR